MSYKFWVAINLSTKNYRGWRREGRGGGGGGGGRGEDG